MQTFGQWFFMTFGLRRKLAVRRTPCALQVERSNIVALRPNRSSRQRPCAFAIGTELRDAGLLYIKPLPKEPRPS